MNRALLRLGPLVVVLTLLVVTSCARPANKSAASDQGSGPTRPSPATRTLRLAGVVEAVRAYSVSVPRLRGQGFNLVLTRMAPAGSRVRAGDVVAEIDPQDQERVAVDRRAAALSLDEQIRKTEADQTMARARDDTELTEATTEVERARLAVTTNRLLPRLEAEKNALALEQAEARLAQLRRTYDLKGQAATAARRILEIRRDRAKQELQDAEQNVRLMSVSAPFEGLVVPKTTFRNGQMVEIENGDEARPGMPLLDVVDASAMRVRLRINQADIGSVAVGQRARVYLDAYPELMFDGRIEQIAPLAVASGISAAVRTFSAVVSVDGGHEKLMPDLTAAVDILLDGAKP